MRVLLTGASGWIGSATVPELLSAGHEVVGVARSDEAAGTIAALGAEVARGTIDDPRGIAQLAAGCDAVIHLAYNHDFSHFAEAAVTDQAVIEAVGEALQGSERPFVIASGVLGLAPGGIGTEEDRDTSGLPRAANAEATLALAERGVRSSVVRLPPTVHGTGDGGFVAFLVQAARTHGESVFVGEGANRWSAVHRLDAASLFRLGLEQAPAGTVLHGVAEEGIETRVLAEAIGRRLGVPTRSVSPEEAGERLGFIGMVFAMEAAATSAATRELLGWVPTGPGLLDDLAAGAYAAAEVAA